MFAIFKRELKAYFTSPLGYVFLAIFYAFSGLFFYIFSLSVGSTDISSVFLMMDDRAYKLSVKFVLVIHKQLCRKIHKVDV